MSDLKVNDQVVVRRPLMHGRGSVVIKTGTILAFADNGNSAVVSFPADKTRATVPVDQLQPVSNLYGRARVQIDPLRRTIGKLMQ